MSDTYPLQWQRAAEAKAGASGINVEEASRAMEQDAGNIEMTGETDLSGARLVVVSRELAIPLSEL